MKNNNGNKTLKKSKSNSRLFKEALALHQAGHLKAAEKKYQEIIKHDANDSNVLHMMGVLSVQLGQFEKAFEQLRHSVSIDPENSDAQNNLGVVLQKKRTIRRGNLLSSACYHTKSGKSRCLF